MKIATATTRSGNAVEQRPILTLPFTVLIDHREHAAWGWHGVVGDSKDAKQIKSKEPPVLIVPRKKQHLPTADYCIEDEGLGIGIYVERKGEDLIDSLGGGHLRFRGEHERLRQLVAEGSEAWMISEQSLSQVLWECDYGGRRLSSETVLTAVATWQELYSVRWVFAGSREAAERLALKVFRLWWGQHGYD